MVAARQLAQRLIGDLSRTRVVAPPQSLCHPDDRAAQARPIITARPLIGVLAVLLGSVISTRDIQFPAAVFTRPSLCLRLPDDLRTRFRHLHSASNRLRRAVFAGPIGDLWRGGLFTES